MNAPTTAQQFKQQRRDFNSNWYKALHRAIADTQERLDKTKQAYDKTLAAAQKKFIQQAVKLAGTPELSDALIFDSLLNSECISHRKEVMLSASFSRIRLGKHHYQALLRNPELLEQRGWTLNRLECAERFMDKQAPTPDDTELQALETELDALKALDKHGSYQPAITRKKSRTYEVGMTATELVEHMQRVYPGKQGEPMTQQEAAEVMKQNQTGKGIAFTSHEAGTHALRQAGRYAEAEALGLPPGTEFIGHHQ